jgi:hypothetical protein
MYLMLPWFLVCKRNVRVMSVAVCARCTPDHIIRISVVRGIRWLHLLSPLL